MDYAEMASELIRKWGEMHRTPRHRKMDEFVQGEKFVLNYLTDRKSPALPSELSDAMNLTTARVAAVLGSLERKGLITRRPDDGDRRRVQVELTREGTAQVLSDRAWMHSMLEDLLRELGERDAREFLRIMGRLIEIGEKKFSPHRHP